MNSDWLAAASFERMHEIVSAVNTLSIHAKLTLASVADPSPEMEIRKARKRLLDFLQRLEAALEGIQQSADGAVVGTDPQLGELALQFLHVGAGGRRGSAPALAMATLPDLIRSNRGEDLSRLVPYLDELRALVEQQTHADVTGILGDRP